jgi:O-methyltransferase involved in polyketide biosynthesis
MPKTQKVHFTEERATMLATLYGRAFDAASADPVLADPTARETVAKIDYDFDRFRMNSDMALSIVLRAQVFDRWTRDFLGRHPEAIVAHLGCGLDSRVYRIDPPPCVDRFDVDYPETIALREQLYPARPGYRMIGSSVTDLAWIDQLPTDRPALVVGEGLTMYLDPIGAPALLSALVRHLLSGEMAFDFYSRTGLKLQKLNSVVRRADATLTWGIDDGAELATIGLTPVERVGVMDFASPDVLRRVSPVVRAQIWLARRVRLIGNMGQILRFTF